MNLIRRKYEKRASSRLRELGKGDIFEVMDTTGTFLKLEEEYGNKVTCYNLSISSVTYFLPSKLVYKCTNVTLDYEYETRQV